MATVISQPPSATATHATATAAPPNSQAPITTTSYPMASLYVGDLHPDVCYAYYVLSIIMKLNSSYLGN
jgi:hypothetical protein